MRISAYAAPADLAAASATPASFSLSTAAASAASSSSTQSGRSSAPLTPSAVTPSARPEVFRKLRRDDFIRTSQDQWRTAHSMSQIRAAQRGYFSRSGREQIPVGGPEMEHGSTNVQEGKTGVESSPFSKSRRKSRF